MLNASAWQVFEM